MTKIAQPEIATQKRLVKLFQEQLGYDYLGDWQYHSGNSNIMSEMLSEWLQSRGVGAALITRALHVLDLAAAVGGGKSLYEANKEVYRLLRYGAKVKEEAGEQTQTVHFIDWEHPENNQFGLAEEVTIAGQHNKRPDLVIYVNGIALAVVELKSAWSDVAKGIRQNLDNQTKKFIRPFYSTVQLIMAGNDSQGLRYGAIETPEKYFLTWKEENPDYDARRHEREQKYLPAASCRDREGRPHYGLLDCAILRLLPKERLLEIIHDFVVFDMGVKKVPRHNQYFGVKAAQRRLARRDGGIIWHTQGSGKSLTMVWLAKWLREHVSNARVLIITDRTELDEQIEGVFQGVDEHIYRTKSSADLIDTLNSTNPWLLCSLVHKFGATASDAAEDAFTEQFVSDLQKNLPANFTAKGELFVFVDECHRTQSGKLHRAMKAILPGATFVGFTGTPLLKTDKQKSIEIFGGYIHTYKFDEAVRDGVVLDLRYEARDIDQYITAQDKIDQWFELKTKGLSDMARAQLKQKWGTMKQVLSSKERLEQIVADILFDMETRPRLMDGRGNAMLVCSSIYQACKVYEMFNQTDLAGKCAIITSYKPSPADIKLEESGEGLTEKLHQYEIYRNMLADFFDQPADDAMARVEEFEQKVKERFKKDPGQMRLLIVVDKLLTGFDAPSATYLYIDKQMRDHGLFQAICRVNRLDGEDKEYGYIVDYKDLFNYLEGAIGDYTGGAFDGYDAEDVDGLLSDRLAKGRERLEAAREQVKAICEAVDPPKADRDFYRYFSSVDDDEEARRRHEPRRIALYKAVRALMRAYANLANEMQEAGYTHAETAAIKNEVKYYDKVAEQIKHHSGDYIDMKRFEPAMRFLIDKYIRAQESETISEFAELGLIELIVEKGLGALDALPEGIREDEEAMAETIENNMRKIIVDERAVNPKYYDEMSALLQALIEERRAGAIAYQAYLQKIKELSGRIMNPGSGNNGSYPSALATRAQRALYDNLDNDEALALRLDKEVRYTKKDNWIGHKFKEREVEYAVRRVMHDAGEQEIMALLELIKNQDEYR